MRKNRCEKSGDVPIKLEVFAAQLSLRLRLAGYENMWECQVHPVTGVRVFRVVLTNDMIQLSRAFDEWWVTDWESGMFEEYIGEVATFLKDKED